VGVQLRPDRRIALWAGVECTVNRVGDRYIDQLELTGHAARESDAELFGWLGVTAARQPVLWERVAPDGLDSARWDWPDRRLARLRELGVVPIVGLLHHGSGPRWTHLLDPAFPAALAGYARRVAERYPWVQDWTPINEPLTTARFSAMYGHWYPHRTSFAEFLRAVVNQCLAVREAMAAIRSVNPSARLVQTEDVGRISATPPLGARQAFDQSVRRLSLDLLCGMVDGDHPLRGHLLEAGVAEADLARCIDEPCRIDLLGLNYYVTSDRFLDHRLDRYPASLHGGDGVRRYVDVESVRVAESELSGHAAMLEEAWERYGLPVAITEAHLGCRTWDEQLRWLAEAWTGAQAARDRGVDVRAVTAWALLGNFGWDRLVIDDQGDYECGMFDVRAPAPRPTEVAHALRTLAHGRPYENPALSSPGWWRRPSRVLFPPPAIPGASEVSQQEGACG
jgi:dTDP-4-dehydrorhamnose reductase